MRASCCGDCERGPWGPTDSVAFVRSQRLTMRKKTRTAGWGQSTMGGWLNVCALCVRRDVGLCGGWALDVCRTCFVAYIVTAEEKRELTLSSTSSPLDSLSPAPAVSFQSKHLSFNPILAICSNVASPSQPSVDALYYRSWPDKVSSLSFLLSSI